MQRIGLATAAVVIIAILISLNFLPNNVTYAKVVDPILSAQALIYDLGDTSDGLFVWHDIVIGRKVRRTIPFMKMDMILDVDNLQILGLDHVHKSASFWGMDQKSADWQRDFMNLIRSVLTDAINDPQSSVEELGQGKIEEFDVVGFRFNPGNDETEITIWADPSTAIPVQIEVHTKPFSGQLGESDFTLNNIEFDVPVDESLVSMELPPGYLLQDPLVFAVNLYEDDFLKVLQIWTKYSTYGAFPNTLKLVDPVQLILQNGESPIPRDILKEYIKEFGLIYIRWVSFFGALENSGADVQYSGNGVQFGEGDKEIFRYRMPDSQFWRVVYGDLYIADVPVENPMQ